MRSTSAAPNAIVLPDPVRAKFLKAAGVWMQENGHRDRAADLYHRALAYHEKVGVKQLIKELQAAQPAK